MMIASAIGRWRARLLWKSTKSAVAPPTSTVVPAGLGRSRIRFTVVLARLGDEGVARRSPAIAVSPLASRCGGCTSATPVDPRDLAPRPARRRGAAAFDATQIGVSRKGGNSRCIAS